MDNIKSIYCITNLINNKKYIGQSIHPYIRFQQHCQKSCQHVSLIHQAIQKYGKENFQFEILESNISNFNEREKYWIKKLNTLQPHGYNLLEGGEFYSKATEGENNNFSLYSDEQFERVLELLKDNHILIKEIELITKVSCSYIHRVNLGTARVNQKNDDNVYPIRNLYTKVTEDNIELIIEDLFNKKLTQKEIADKYHVSAALISIINTGKHWKQPNIDYPIRKKRIKTRWGYYKE